MKSRGLGDTIHKFTSATGIKRVVDTVAKATNTDCGCDRRRDTLNRLFPYNKPECLNEDEFNYLDTYFKAKSNVISAETQDKLLVIYNRVFHENKQATNCSSCFRNELHNKLERVYIEYLKEN